MWRHVEIWTRAKMRSADEILRERVSFLFMGIPLVEFHKPLQKTDLQKQLLQTQKQ